MHTCTLLKNLTFGWYRLHNVINFIDFGLNTMWHTCSSSLSVGMNSAVLQSWVLYCRFDNMSKVSKTRLVLFQSFCNYPCNGCCYGSIGLCCTENSPTRSIVIFQYYIHNNKLWWHFQLLRNVNKKTEKLLYIGLFPDSVGVTSSALPPPTLTEKKKKVGLMTQA